MVISTVAKTIYEFFEIHPDANIQIIPRDVKLKRFYNTIFKRRYKEVEDIFTLKGIDKDGKTLYNHEKIYSKFEIKLKKM